MTVVGGYLERNQDYAASSGLIEQARDYELGIPSPTIELHATKRMLAQASRLFSDIDEIDETDSPKSLNGSMKPEHL